ncbi:MAG TPA: hypothetical protein VIT92_00935 [Burkholderiaceae bacterium]
MNIEPSVADAPAIDAGTTEQIAGALSASANALLDSLIRAPDHSLIADDDSDPVASAQRHFRVARDAGRTLPLPGLHVLLHAIDALFGKLRLKQLDFDRDIALAISDAYQAATGYLNRCVQDGAPPALHLYPYLAGVRKAAQESAPEPAELLFVPPGSLDQVALPDAALPASAWRPQFEKALLPFLRGDADYAAHVHSMRDVIAAVAQTRSTSEVRAQWLVLLALADTVAAGLAAPPLSVKRLFGAINTQLRHLQIDTLVPAALTGAALHYLAASAPLPPLAQAVADAADLTTLVPPDLHARRYDTAVDYEPEPLPAPPAPAPAPRPEERAAALDQFIGDSDRAILQLCEDLATWRAAPERPAVLQAISHLQGIQQGAALHCEPLHDLALALEIVLRSVPDRPGMQLIGADQLDVMGRAVEGMSGMLQALATGETPRADTRILLELAQLQFNVEKKSLSPFSAQALDQAGEQDTPASAEDSGGSMEDIAANLSDSLEALLADSERLLDAGPSALNMEVQAAGAKAEIEDHYDQIMLAELTSAGAEQLHLIGLSLRAWRQNPEDQAYAAVLVSALQKMHEAARVAGALRLAFALYEIEIQIEMHLDSTRPDEAAPSPLFDSLLAHYAECVQLFEQLPRA